MILQSSVAIMEIIKALEAERAFRHKAPVEVTPVEDPNVRCREESRRFQEGLRRGLTGMGLLKFMKG